MVDGPFLVVGLGNPGGKYEGTRHNVGFDVLDHFAAHHGTTLSINKWDGDSCKIQAWGQTMHLVKPLTFMNLSGRSVSRFIDFFKIPSLNMVVIHDDLDMGVGRLKLVKGGGSGGHNGIRSIIECLGTNEFFRLKVGIGRPGNSLAPPQMSVEKFVLTPFYQEEADLIKERFDVIVDGLQLFFTDGPSKSMSHLNSFK